MSPPQLFPSASRFTRSIGNGRVAIITRTKNRPLLLARAFASMLDQRYQNWHLYLVNDGGDPTPVEALLAQYQTAFAGRASVLHHPQSLGMEAASNAGLATVSDCDYVVVHDDDDAWHPDFLQRCVRFLQAPANAGYTAVASRCELIFEEILGDEVIERRREPLSYWKPQVDLIDQLIHNRFPPICLLIRRAAVTQIGPFNAELPVLGDWDYNLRLLLLGDIGTINEDLAFYHHRIDNQLGSIYGNSVHSGIDKHQLYQTLYRNSLLRPLLQKEPGYLGLAHVLLKSIDGVGNEGSALRAKLDWMHWDINNNNTDLRAKLDWMHWDINNNTDLRARLDKLQTSVDQLQQRLASLIPDDPEQAAKFGADARFVLTGMHKLLHPIYWVWHKLLPPRRMLARLRGRA